MAFSPGPRTPDITPKRAVGATRSFTTPNLSSSPNAPRQSAEIGSTKGIETTYKHPNGRIFKFQTAAGTPSNKAGRPAVSSGTLPWATPTETTIAVGPFEIYHVPGSVCFLRAGKLLQALLPKSQCWCVDGVSKFVIRGSIDTYYRIEIPGETEADLEEVEKLKATLQQLISYEKTPCPFARTFTVDLPEQQPEPRKKRRRHTEGRAKKWKLDRAYGWRPEGWEPGMDEPEELEDESASASSSGTEHDSSGQEEADNAAELAEGMDKMNVAPSARAKAMQALRSASMPGPSKSQQTPPPKMRPKAALDGTAQSSEASSSSTVRGTDPAVLRTFQSMPTDMPPSPPDSSAGADYTDVQAPAEGWVEVVEIVEEPAKGLDEDELLEAGAQAQEPSSDVNQAENRDQEPHASTSFHTSTDIDREDNMSQPADTIPAVPVTTEMPTAVEQVYNSADSLQELEPPTPDSLPTTQGDDDSHSLNTPAREDEHSTNDSPPVPPIRRQRSAEDPYAAIQARILARRSLSGTTSFHPLRKSATRSSSSSTSSAATIISNKSSRAHRSRQQNEDLATAMVKRIYTVFLGPPAQLVVLMLKIAARIAAGTFGVNGMFHVESPLDSPRRPPGSFHLQFDGENNLEAVEVDSDDEEDEDWEDHEDDFGVKLNQSVSNLTGLRERRPYDVD